MNNKDISNEWFKMAELDYNSAKFLLGMNECLEMEEK